MKNEQQMLNLFQVEELEKRYEMRKWSPTFKVKAIMDFDGNTTVEVGGEWTP